MVALLKFKPSASVTLFGAALLVCLVVNPAWGEVRLPTLLSDGMVLQRDAPVRVWGWADPGEKVRIRLRNSTATVTASRQGEWSASLGPFAAGGPFEMRIAGRNEITLHDILVGDVWLASGQSNMEMPVGATRGFPGVENARETVTGADYPRIRLFTLDRATTLNPSGDAVGTGWRPATPGNVDRFSAVAYFFGRELHQRYRIPIGIIESDWGGTHVEAWMSRAALTRFPEFAPALSALDQDAGDYYERIMPRKRAWYSRHGDEDRGRSAGRDVWADPALDASAWPKMQLPRTEDALRDDFNGFAGVVWFRKELQIPPGRKGCDLVVHLGEVVRFDSTFWNGAQVGSTNVDDVTHDYYVPGELVQEGRNTLTVRLVGANFYIDSYIGMLGPAEAMRAEACGTTIPLAGTWSYQSGPDLRDFPVVGHSIRDRYPVAAPPTTLFNGMIHPVTPYRIKGVIWYQGEANALEGRTAQYRRLFPDLIEDWRTSWGYSFPFLFVQLAGFGPDGADPAESRWAELREAQTMALSLASTGMATAVDVGDEKNIHPKNKLAVAHRLALVAAHVAYGERNSYSGPTFDSMQIEANRVRIKYTGVESGLVVKDRYGYVRGFEVAGPDGRFVWAHARPDGNDMLVFDESVKHPVAVRYDWTNTPDGNVFNRDGLPATPFRTDGPQGSPFEIPSGRSDVK